MKLNKAVQCEIESLTSNEDFRQDLWVAYLSGQQHLPTILQKIQEEHIKIEEFQIRLHRCVVEELSITISQLLENFSGMEKSILYLLIMGYDVNDIGDQYGTSPVRIQQAIRTIQKHSIWNKLLVSV